MVSVFPGVEIQVVGLLYVPASFHTPPMVSPPCGSLIFASCLASWSAAVCCGRLQDRLQNDTASTESNASADAGMSTA
jgi:hypothetical protein